LRERSVTNPKNAVEHFRATLASKRYRQEAGERYGYALALLHAHQPEQARREARHLLQQAPTNIAYLILNARVDAESGQAPRALKSIATALDLFPGNYPLASYFAQLSLEQGLPAQAVKPLDEALERYQDEPRLYELRSRVAAATGQRADAHLFLADASYLDGQLEKAVQQLGVALRTEHFDYYDESKLRARLGEINRELKAEKEAEKKGN
jgi:predicted Zn-dependent protease